MKAAAGAVLIGALLIGCSSGQVTQTSDKYPSIVGYDARAGDIYVRDAAVERPARTGAPSAPIVLRWPEGSNVPLGMYMISRGDQDDVLIGVETDDADGIALVDGAGIERDESPGPGASGSASPTASTSASRSASTGAAPTTRRSASPTASPAAAASPALPADLSCGARVELPVPAQSAVAATPSGSQYVVLCGLRRTITLADSITAVLIFRDAGRVNLSLTIRTAQSAVPRGSASPHGEEE